MTRLTAATVVSQLPTIDHKGLLTIQRALAMLLTTEEQNSGGHPDGFEAVMYEALIAEFEERGLRRAISWDQFRKMNQYRNWRRNLPAVEDFMNTHFKEHMKDRRVRSGICRLLIGSLMNELKRRELSISYGIICSNIGRLSEVFDNAFPGYLQSGMAGIIPMVLKRRGLA